MSEPKKKRKKSSAASNGGGGMTDTFAPDRSSAIAGFWRPEEKGESIEGILVEKAEGRNSDYLVVKITRAMKVVSRDKNTDEEITRTANEGREVGVSYWASLRGLERKSGHWVKITVLGKEKFSGDDGQNFQRWKTDVQVSKDIHDPKLLYVAAPKEPRRGFGRSRPPSRSEMPNGPAPDDDVPF
jgi:hypothetical protein